MISKPAASCPNRFFVIVKPVPECPGIGADRLPIPALSSAQFSVNASHVLPSGPCVLSEVDREEDEPERFFSLSRSGTQNRGADWVKEHRVWISSQRAYRAARHDGGKRNSTDAFEQLFDKRNPVGGVPNSGGRIAGFAKRSKRSNQPT